jgi:threonine/homoserine/homoserine lactone efflux protein
MILKGFRFGMLLQIAVGPVCLFILNTSISKGFTEAMSGVAAVSLVDALFIMAAILGVAAILEKNKSAKVFFKYFGALVLILFGLQTVLGVFGISILPDIDIFKNDNAGTTFFTVLFLTISNPLTIMFWAGVFSSRIVDDGMNRRDMYLFGAGAVLSTLSFMTFISLLGSVLGVFVPITLMNVLNIAVGAVLIGFGIKTAYSK